MRRPGVLGISLLIVAVGLTILSGSMPAGTATVAAPLTIPQPETIHAASVTPSLAAGVVPSFEASPHPTWTEVNTSTQPSARELAGMTYDATDGYVVLFGGWNDTGWDVGSASACNHTSCCFNDTWTYQDGTWTNLSIPGPPPTCAPDMTFDKADGYVVMYSALSYFGGVGSNGSLGDVNQTWTFVHGKWTRCHTSEPDAMPFYSSMTYDATLGAVLLVGDHYEAGGTFTETWEFKGGAWTRSDYSDTPKGIWWSSVGFDAIDGSAVLLGNSSIGNKGWSAATQTYVKANGSWIDLGELPSGLRKYAQYLADNYCDVYVLAFDSKDGYLLLYGAPLAMPYLANTNNAQVSLTWSYQDGSWTNESIGGPPGRIAPSLAFDAADGYMLLFGGMSGGYDANGTIESYVPMTWLDDTWIYTAPPVAAHVTISTSPPKVCSAVAPDCGVGTTESRITVGVDVTSVPSNPVWGNDSGKGTILYGPSYWLDTPSVSFLGWGNVTPAGNLDPSVACYRDDNGPTDCPTGPSFSSVNGMTQLTWNWSHPSDGIFDALRQGDTWEISFNVQVAGPPFGPVPVDSCTTSACREAGSWSVGGAWSNFSFSPSGNESRTLDSLPLGTLDVLPPVTTSTTPSGSPPPPPPPPPSVGAPAPVGLPSPPTSLPAPPNLGPISVTSALSGISTAAVAAGILGAGVTRGVVSRPAQGVRVASRVAAAKRRSKVRGED